MKEIFKKRKKRILSGKKYIKILIDIFFGSYATTLVENTMGVKYLFLNKTFTHTHTHTSSLPICVSRKKNKIFLIFLGLFFENF